MDFEEVRCFQRHRLPVGKLVLAYHPILISDRPSASARKKVKFSGNRPPVRGYCPLSRPAYMGLASRDVNVLPVLVAQSSSLV